MKLLSVVGARPQFIKLSSLARALIDESRSIKHVIVHSGQHYDYYMSRIFFNQLRIPKVNYHLNVGSASHGAQTAEMLKRIEAVLIREKPDWVIVYGDTNTTLSAALAAVKLSLPIAHVEAGLRSFDRSMPEEVNRVLVDQVSELLFTPSKGANSNLLREGISKAKIHFVGNVMIDTLVDLLPKAEERWGQLKRRFGVSEYVLITLHRPSNVDDLKILRNIISSLKTMAKKIPVIFPLHPRTRKMGEFSGLINLSGVKGLHLIQPLGYLDFLSLEKHASLVLTDSGGIQEETTFLGTPCLTLRPNTERPITVTLGTNRLIRSQGKDIVMAVRDILRSGRRSSKRKLPEFWDGHASERIVKVIKNISSPRISKGAQN
jgi:UDP-N-acetylglucosamine 2-epimerase (non-hydrolysing)